MSDETRLRRLDALFSEKVLGLPLTDDKHLIVISPPTVSPIDPHFGTSVYKTVPTYTRSLDAAWEATHKKFCCRTLFSHHDHYHRVKVCLADKSVDHADFRAEALHPAEALVLAGLRAVGCSEEELV